MLQVQSLQCIRGDRCLFNALNFELQAGELLHVYGHNGAGKTTLLRALCSLIQPSQGEILWQGQSIFDHREDYLADLLYLGHKNAIKEDLTGIENLIIHCRLNGIAIDEKKAWQVLEQMGLRGHEDLPSKVLSQGQQKRVALARLLVSSAPLWILDEPFVGLDVAAIDFLQSVLIQHVEEGGLVILTTHQPLELTSGQVKKLKLGWKEDGRV